MVIAAAVSGDETLQTLLAEGKDLHIHTAKTSFEVGQELSDADFKKKYKKERQDAKIVNFSQLYAGTWYTLHRNFGFSKEKAQMLEAGFKKAFPRLSEWMEETYATLRRDGQIEYPEFGYIKRMKMPPRGLQKKDPQAYDKQVQAALRTCLNALIQGYAAFIAKQAVVETNQALKEAGLDAQVWYQIHDEIAVLAHKRDAAKAKEILVSKMERTVQGVFLGVDPEYKYTLSKAEKGVEESELVKEFTRVSYKALADIKEVDNSSVLNIYESVEDESSESDESQDADALMEAA